MSASRPAGGGVASCCIVTVAFVDCFLDSKRPKPVHSSVAPDEAKHIPAGPRFRCSTTSIFGDRFNTASLSVGLAQASPRTRLCHRCILMALSLRDSALL
ncbi:hypothetical protein LX32DRAFT_637382 [Colletotrichum zoysiae]|uniref:Uncharacterized protein n=1 Tax=Colletotrichum zoysiae TaxID=1216348 RepID=A0AAD9M331_9PEZI|nr:hypothetical protein LX32DRAFT_637382 [Colletotrichum zoysiae]